MNEQELIEYADRLEEENDELHRKIKDNNTVLQKELDEFAVELAQTHGIALGQKYTRPEKVGYPSKTVVKTYAVERIQGRVWMPWRSEKRVIYVSIFMRALRKDGSQSVRGSEMIGINILRDMYTIVEDGHGRRNQDTVV